MKKTKRVPKYLTEEILWRDVQPGMLIGASWGFGPLETIGITPNGVWVKMVGQPGWFQHPSQTVTIGHINPEYKGA